MCGVTRPLGAMVRQLDSARFTMLTGRCQQSARCKLLQDELSEKLELLFSFCCDIEQSRDTGIAFF